MPIEFSEAQEQIDRLSGLDRFPHGTERLKAWGELIAVARMAYSVAVLKAFVDDWLASQRVCPKPADIRIAILEVNARIEPQKPKCRMCGGNGFVTEFYDVERDAAYKIKSSQKMEIANNDEMYLYSEQNPDAEILSAAKPCSCHPISRGAQGPSA